MVSSETFKVVAIIERGSYFERSLILWNMVKVPRQRRTTAKGKTLSWNLREGDILNFVDILNFFILFLSFGHAAVVGIIT